MMSRASSTQPPRIAVWLVGLFTPDQEAESIPGDLLEEFSHLASNSGVPFARRWYWRQIAKTIAHLFGNRAPCRAVVNRRCRSRRIFIGRLCPWVTRQGAVRSYRQIPRLLVEPFQSLHVLGDRRNVGRTPDSVGVRWVYGRVGGQGKGDGCHDDASHCPLHDGWSCILRRRSKTLAHGLHPFVDAISVLWSVRHDGWRTHR